MNQSKEEFTVERMLNVFADNPPKSAQEANKAVFDAVHEFAGDVQQSDDITCLMLHVKGASG